MQMKKRVLSAFMALCMVCSLVGAAWAVIPQQTSAAANGQFTITWKYDSDWGSTFDSEKAITVTCYNSDTNEVLNVSPSNINNNSDTQVDLTADNQDLQIDGYELDRAAIGYSGRSGSWNVVKDGINSIKASYSWGSWSYQYDNEDWNSRNGTPTIRLYYSEVQSDFYIKDTIATDGLFTATFGSNITIPSDATVEYTWYRSETGAEDSWQEVELQRVTGTQDNIVDNGRSINVAYDSIAANAKNSERYWYYVTATVTSNGNSQTYTADPLQVPYYIELQNGSFEAPAANHWNNQVSNGTEGLIWQTTGEGSGNHDGADVEIVRSTDEKFSDEGQQKTYQKKVEEIYSPSSAADGAQFAELNCEAYGALYQDVLTVPGVDLNWYLEHCARQGTDTMALVIMPTTRADGLTQQLEKIANGTGSNDSKAQQIRTALDGVASDSGVFVDYYQAGTGTWKYHNGTYTVPENQYLTRFFFVAVSTGSGNATVGNLLDNVGFGTDVPEPQEDQGILTVTKYVDGYVPDSDYSVTVTAGDESFTFNDFRLDSVTGKYYASHTFTYQMQAYDTQIVKVSETVSGAPTDYTATSTVAVGGGQATTGQSTLATITAGATQTVTFTNTYQQLEPLTPEHNKYIKDNGDGTYDLSLNVTGTISESTEKIPINVLYVLDESYSMMWTMDGNYPNDGDGNNDKGDEPGYNYSFERYKAACDAVNALNTALKENGSLDVQVGLVEFAKTTRNTQNQVWTALNRFQMPNAEYETFETGTNYGAAIHDAKDLLSKLSADRKDAETIVIFITDGEPNRAVYDDTSHSDNVDESMAYAAREIANLQADKFYAIGVGNEIGDDRLSQLANYESDVKESYFRQSSKSEELVRYFQELAAHITSVDCSDVTIQDTFSDYAERANETLTITVTNAQGQQVVTGTGTVQLSETDLNAAATLTASYTQDGRSFTLDFPDKYKLEDGWTYTVTATIKPTDKAYSDYAANIAQADNNGYGDMVGDSGTDAPGNDTSSGKPGFYSNTTADLTYDSNGVEDVKEEYPKPVIQVKLGNLTLEKQVEGLEGNDNANNEQFTFTVTGPKTAVGYQDFTAGVNNTATKQVTVTPGNPVTLNNLPYGTYTVTEANPASEIVNGKYYFVSKTDSATVDLGTDKDLADDTATITNTYAPYRTVTITKDVGGNMGDTTHPFNFTTSITPKDGKEYSLTQSTQTNATLRGNTTGEGATATWTDSGYTLADGDTLTITKLKDGDVITLKETDGNSNGYTTVYKISETELSKDNDGNATYKVAGDANIIVTNERNVGTPTGFFEDNLPFTLMISAAGLAGIALIATILVRRQRRRRE